MINKLLRKVVPVPLRSSIRKAVLFLIPPLRRQLRPMGRRRRQLRRIMERRRRQLRRLWHRQTKLIGIQLKSAWLYMPLYTSYMRRRNPPVETNNQIHLISNLSTYGGGEQRTLHLFEELKDHAEVSLWSEYQVHPEISEKYLVKQIIPMRFEFPRTGTFVFIGVWFSIGPWFRYTNPRRIIVIHNSDMPPAKFRQKLRKLSKMGRRKVEVAYASELTKRLVNDPGIIQPSLIDLDRFVPSVSNPSDSKSANFTVGRLSRDVRNKHHPDDAALYRQLVDHGCRVRIMGPSRPLQAELDGLESVTLLPMLAQEAHLFLQGLDCFFYRTSEEFLEPSGRVVTEAMACGLPVVCHNRGGYVELIHHGQNGFLFDTQQEALEILLRLKDDRTLRESIGKAARETVEELFSPARRAEIVEFYSR